MDWSGYKRWHMCFGVGMAFATSGMAWAQQVTPLKDICANPSAYHWQAVVIRGTVLMPGEMRGANAWGQQLCGQRFVLDDETGQVPVMCMTICQQGNGTELRVHNGETVTIEATMDAAATNMRTITGRGLGVSAVAKRITREEHGGVQIIIDAIR